jgi:hypothetical protein
VKRTENGVTAISQTCFDSTTGFPLARRLEQHDEHDAKRHNCDQMQGYLINAPMPAAELGAIPVGADVLVVDEA